MTFKTLFLLFLFSSCNMPLLQKAYDKIPKTINSEKAPEVDPIIETKSCDVTVGNGSGTVAIDSVIAKSEKVICIKSGIYNDLDVHNLTSVGKPIVIQNEGLVEFTGRMYLSNLKNVTVSGSGTPGLEHGIIVRDTKYRGTTLSGKFHTFTLKYISYQNVPDYVISWDRPDLNYRGVGDSTFQNVKFLHLLGQNIGPLIMLYPSREELKDPLMNVEVAYNKVIDSPKAGSVIVMNSAYNADIHHNSFENVSTSINEHSGIIFLCGDGKIHHNSFRNVLGNSMRTWPVSLKNNLSPGSLDFYNNVTVGSIKYSMIEVQPFADHLNMQNLTTFTNIKIYNNTAGNLNHGVALPAGPALWTAGLVDLYSSNGGTIDIQNNLLFNVNKPRSADSYIINSQGSWPEAKLTNLNNLYFADYVSAGLNNLKQIKPKANSPVVGKGAALGLVKDDFYGVKRPSGVVDVGAVEH